MQKSLRQLPKGGICMETSALNQCQEPELQQSAPASRATFPSTWNSSQRSKAASSLSPARQTYFGTSAMSSTARGGGGGGGWVGGTGRREDGSRGEHCHLTSPRNIINNIGIQCEDDAAAAVLHCRRRSSMRRRRMPPLVLTFAAGLDLCPGLQNLLPFHKNL